MVRTPGWIGRTAISLFLLASLSAGSVVLPHAGGDDAGCGPVFVNHDAGAHHIGIATSIADRDAQHCYLCHSLRSFFSLIDKYEQRDLPLHSERLHAGNVAPPDRLAHSLALGRAPPA